MRSFELGGVFSEQGRLEVPGEAFDPEGAPLVMNVWGQDLAWDGRNDQGQAVSNGTYKILLAFTDSYGAVQALAAQATVLGGGSGYSLRIFNSAGELVRTLAWRLPYGQVEPDRLQLLEGSKPWRFDLGSLSLDWDGLNELGRPVQSGIYHALLEVSLPRQSPKLYRSSLQILASPEGASLAGLQLAPNPALPGATLGLKLPEGDWVELELGLYGISGELVARGSGRGLALPGGLAPGVYLLEVKGREASGRPQRAAKKLAVIQK